jgi:stringent starvation protein B
MLNKEMTMISIRPYLLRAYYQWILDNKLTPILVLDATNPHCKIPLDYVEGGEIVFNVSPIAVQDFKIENKTITFKASFSGVIHLIAAPTRAVIAIYAEENNEGLFFDEEELDVDLMSVDNANLDLQELSQNELPPTKGKPILRLLD